MISESLIHPTALVSPGAKLGPGVEVGAYSVIGPNVKIGAGTKIFSHAVIDGQTTIGKNNTIYPFTSIGLAAQDRRAKNQAFALEIGDENQIREYVSIHSAATPEGKTTIGSRNIIMACAHVAHDCTVGNDIVIANGTLLAGYVTIEDRVTLSGMVGVHQFVRVGTLALVGAISKLAQDVPPFSVYNGQPAVFRGPNTIGLKRAGYKPEARVAIKSALKILLQAGDPLESRLEALKKQFAGNGDVETLITFVKNSKRGLTAASGSEPETGEE